MPTYRLFGVDLASDYPFVSRLMPGRAPAQLTFTLTPEPVLPRAWEDSPPVYSSHIRLPEGDSAAHLYRFGGCEIFRFTSTGDFFLGAEWIACHALPRTAGRPDLIESPLLGPVLSYWLERRGIPTLHASAVAVGDRAIAFLSRQGGGKSGLAAAMMSAGCPLLTDDLLPIEELEGTFFAQPAYPEMRMWPDEAAHFVERWTELPLVRVGGLKRRVPVGEDGWGVFHGSALPLACLYIAERRSDGPIEISEIVPRDAFIELVRRSFSPHLAEGAGLQPARFDLLARFAQQVPVRRLLYPSDFKLLPEVAETLLR